jgi:hypothetical protein
MERAALRELIYQRGAASMNPRCRKQSAYMQLASAFPYIRAQCGRTAVRRFISRSEESALYNRINRKSGAFPRKRISVIYARRTGRSVKETGGAIARLKHYD